MNASFLEQRKVLRLRLQAQREDIALQISKAEFIEDEFPRSITMRLLTQPSALPILVLKQLLPILVRQFFKGTSTKS